MILINFNLVPCKSCGNKPYTGISAKEKHIAYIECDCLDAKTELIHRFDCIPNFSFMITKLIEMCQAWNKLNEN